MIHPRHFTGYIIINKKLNIAWLKICMEKSMGGGGIHEIVLDFMDILR